MRLAIGLVLAAAFAAALVYSTLAESEVECEVCMAFGGRQSCRTVAAADRAYAVSMATSNACADLTGGVTRGIQCSAQTPRSIRCDGD